MLEKKCCVSCKQCVTSNFDSYSWCKLRKIKIHSDISSLISCYHWIKKESSLTHLPQKIVHQQLDFGQELVSNDN